MRLHDYIWRDIASMSRRRIATARRRWRMST